MDECTICLENTTLENKKITECKHTFHTECLEKWLTTNNSCPLCRSDIIFSTIIKSFTRGGDPIYSRQNYPRISYTSGQSRQGLLFDNIAAFGGADYMQTFNMQTFNMQTGSMQTGTGNRLITLHQSQFTPQFTPHVEPIIAHIINGGYNAEDSIIFRSK